MAARPPGTAVKPEASPVSESKCTHDQSISEEEIDPFTYRPPLTRWDYLKVSNINSYWVTNRKVIPSVEADLVC